MEMLHC